MEALQLNIQCELVNPHLYDAELVKYTSAVTIKDHHPVYLVMDTKRKTYFISYFFSKETVESYKNHKILL